MNATFLTGFYDELVKTAAPPLLQTVGKSGTMLGQKVQGAVSRSLKRSEKIGRRAARGAGLKGIVEKKASEDGGFYDEEDEDEGAEGADEAGEMLRRIMAQYQQDGGYTEEPEAQADAPMYGTGTPKKGATKHAEDAVSAGRGYEDRRAGRAPKLPPPPPATKAQRAGWQGADLSNIPMPKKPPAPRNLQAELDGLGGAKKTAPKLTARPRQVQGPAPRTPAPRTLPTDLD